MTDEIELTSTGGKMSKIEGLPTLIPPHALAAISKVMRRGSKYGIGNWHKIPISSQQSGEIVDTGLLDHAVQHYINFMVGNGDPLEELSHATARMMMSLDQYIRENEIDLDLFKG